MRPDPVVTGARTQTFEGRTYFRNRNRGQYYVGWDRAIRRPVSLHVAVWTATHGKPAKGMHVHHINEDKSDNRLCNLELKTARDHLAEHMTPERREWARRNIVTTAVPAARAWHASPEGREWHSRHGVEVMAARLAAPPLNRICEVCGANYETHDANAQYCGPNCRAKRTRDRRKAGVPIDPKRQTVSRMEPRQKVCGDCGATFPTRSGRVLRCDPCRRAHTLEYHRQKWLARKSTQEQP